MRMKDKLDEMQNPNIEIVDAEMMLNCDKVILSTTNGENISVSTEQITVINDTMIQYKFVHSGTTYVQHVSIDKIVLVQYIYNNNK